jgi:protoporphyrinogen oxidase
MSKKTVIIIGAGPAGLTAAYELLQKESDITPVILEASQDIGGISKTVKYKGNRIDIGGHRFFSKSDRVMQWWQDRMPIFGAPAKDDLLLNRDVELSDKEDAPDPEKEDNTLLIRNRLSRILFLGNFFDYPVTLSKKTIQNLGLIKMGKIGFSYMFARIFPIKDERSLEDFFINRFGKELYETFFKDYTQKVWGVPCDEIKAEWGAQRIKGLSITKTLAHAFKKLFETKQGISQKEVETSLIERFLYPKYGPGQMWEHVADLVREQGGEIIFNRKVVRINQNNGVVSSIVALDESHQEVEMVCEYVISTMPVRELISSINDVPQNVQDVASGLMYRDFLTVGLLLNKLKIKNETKIKTVANIVPDNWIYIQEPQVRVGRLQVFNNWSPYMVEDPQNTVWIGLEYFCNEGDDIWSKSDEAMKQFGIDELVEIGVIEAKDVLDSVAIKVPKAYPAYFGTYDDFDQVREFTDSIENLFLIGRNGTHRYNNMDHSMLSAMETVENMVNGITTKENIWNVNTEKEYHESK